MQRVWTYLEPSPIRMDRHEGVGCTYRPVILADSEDDPDRAAYVEEAIRRRREAERTEH